MREFGGYLPLELPQKNEYFLEAEYDFLRLNCGRSAIYCALKDSNPTKVYIPFYNCDTVREPFEKLKIPYEYYKIDNDFLPINVQLKENEYLLYVNYYGILGTSTLDYINEKYKSVYFDNTQAFFSAPYENTYNIYSCRKFFGVSDGAYLIKKGISTFKLPFDISCDRMLYTLKAIEYTTHEAYQLHLANEDNLATDIKVMSLLTQRILKSVDYDDIKRHRKQNFLILHKLLGGKNEFKIDISTNTPIAYPFLIKDEEIRRKLITNKIYVPCWWKHVLGKTDEGDFENYLSKYMIPLPIDQRYNVSDMEELAEKVIKIFRC